MVSSSFFLRAGRGQAYDMFETEASAGAAMARALRRATVKTVRRRRIVDLLVARYLLSVRLWVMAVFQLSQSERRFSVTFRHDTWRCWPLVVT
jgi:hypothetical protein